MDERISRILLASDNPPSKGERGTGVVDKRQRAILGSKVVRAYLKDPKYKPEPGDIVVPWSMDSRRWLHAIAKFEPDYRVLNNPAFEAYNYLYGVCCGEPWLDRRIAESGVEAAWIGGDQLLCSKVARSCRALGLPYAVQSHTCAPWYIKTRVRNQSIRNYVLEDQRKRSIEALSGAVLRTAPSQWYIDFWRDWTGIDLDFELFPSIVEPIPLMDEDEKRRFRDEFFETYGRMVPMELRGREIVGGISRVTPEKCPDKAIRSFAVLVRACEANGKVPPIMILGGDCSPDYKAELERLAKDLGILHLLFLIGAVDHDTALKFLQICIICFLLSLSETQGLVLQEAQMAGSIAPVLAGTALEERQYIRDLVFPDDPEVIGWFVYKLLYRERQRIIEITEHQLKLALRDNDPVAYATRFLGHIERVRCGKC